jgi:hypothetical protein
MDGSSKGIAIGLLFALILIIPPFVSAQQAGEDNNKNLSQNNNSESRDNTRAIVNLKNHTVTVIDTRTNEPISVKSYTPKTNASATQSETLTTNAENATTSGILVPEKTKINDTFADTQNTTNSLNLTEKFESLSK